MAVSSCLLAGALINLTRLWPTNCTSGRCP